MFNPIDVPPGMLLMLTILNPLPKQVLVFTHLHYQSLENTLEKGEMLVTSNFSFSHRVFYPFGEFSAMSYQI